MNRWLSYLLFAFSIAASAQAPHMKSGSAVYIEPMDGYETYLAAAIAKKHVPLVVVADEDKADYIIRSSISQKRPSQPAVVVNNTTNVNSNSYPRVGGFPRAGYGSNFGSTSASISVVDVHSSQIVFAYSVGKGRNTNQIQSTAEACAKHLKEFIEKSGK
ncbi:hypothetical protein [Edaphobacter sp.]|uniref:hypothetical protein n=1 Tax=Edaphobacter sp. TaxID=1934404 RepID=UPI002DB98D6F|nr:hypothetical protein [Edaphobacter sp.]HEU5340152.1 hypothetical protein [Edaphobacter sp.]